MDLTAVLVLTLGVLLGALVATRLRRTPAPVPASDVTDTLARLDGQIRAMEMSRERAYGGLAATLDSMRAETAALAGALRTPHTRGRWGEMQLRRVIEVAGGLEHCDFTEQATTSNDDGALRPDAVVHLAGGKHVVVDAKVPCAAYLEAVEARDDATREDRLRAHARQLREHVKALASKQYWSRFDPAPEFVVLFVPADAFLDAALRADPTLQEYAFASHVVVATPSTLVALIRTVAYTWRQDALAENARDVSALGRELYQRLGTLGGHLDDLGKALERSVGSYNQAVGSLESRVLVSARRFAALGVSTDELPAPRQVDAAPRVAAAPELETPSRYGDTSVDAQVWAVGPSGRKRERGGGRMVDEVRLGSERPRAAGGDTG